MFKTCHLQFSISKIEKIMGSTFEDYILCKQANAGSAQLRCVLSVPAIISLRKLRSLYYSLSRTWEMWEVIVLNQWKILDAYIEMLIFVLIYTPSRICLLTVNFSIKSFSLSKTFPLSIVTVLFYHFCIITNWSIFLPEYVMSSIATGIIFKNIWSIKHVILFNI